MKKLIALWVTMLALSAGAINITNYPIVTTFDGSRWFFLSDVGAKTNYNLPGNYVVSTSRLDYETNLLWSFMGTNMLVVKSNAYFLGTNYFNTIYVTNGWFTNLYAEYAWITNLYVSNGWFTNLYADYAWITNLYVSNLYAGDIYVTNQVHFFTNVWSGPTNDINISGPYDLNYTTMTPVAITGFTNLPTQTTSEVLLSIYNASGSNIDMTFPAGLVDGNWLSSQTISNNAVGCFWLRYTPVFPRTNVVFRGM